MEKEDLKRLLKQVEEIDKEIDESEKEIKILILKRNALLDVIETGTAKLMIEGKL